MVSSRIGGMSDKEARILLPCSEEDFNIIFDDMVRSKLLSRIHQIKRGGLGVTLYILFSTMMIEIPGMKEFYNTLINVIDREDALKRHITHKEPILIAEEALTGAMSM